MSNFLNGIIHLPFLALSIISIRDIKLEDGQPTVQSLVIINKQKDLDTFELPEI